MFYNKQLYLHAPEFGSHGDCFRTCIANLLELWVEDVPNFANEELYSNHNVATKAWLNEKGFDMVAIPFESDCVENALIFTTSTANTDIPCIFSGVSKNGTNHAVIACNGKIIHDPAIDASGIVGPCTDGYYWLEWIVVKLRIEKGNAAAT